MSSTRLVGGSPGGTRRQRPVEGGLRSEKIGGNVYELTPSPAAYITATGVQQDTVYNIPESYRVNKIELTHVDGADAPTGMAATMDVHLKDRGSGVLWRPVLERCTTATSVLAEYGVEFNWTARQVRVRINAPVDHRVYPLFTVQYLEGVN